MSTLAKSMPVDASSPVGATAPTFGELQQARRRRRQWLSVAPLAIVVFVALVGPALVPHDPERVVAIPELSPRADHLMGTDSMGLDVFSRTISAAQTDLLIATMVMVAATAGGIIVGLIVGMNESRRGPLGYLARATARAVDLLQALPAVVIALVVVSFLGASILTITISLGLILAPNQARLVRTEVLRVRSEAYLDAARMAGLSELRLTIRHALPNSAWPALENASVLFGVAIILTATLGFLGVGVAPPKPEWGSMIAGGTSDAAVGRWWPALFPALALAVSVASVATAARTILGHDSSA